MRHPKSLAISYKLLIINNSILSQQKSDEVGWMQANYQPFYNCWMRTATRAAPCSGHTFRNLCLRTVTSYGLTARLDYPLVTFFHQYFTAYSPLFLPLFITFYNSSRLFFFPNFFSKSSRMTTFSGMADERTSKITTTKIRKRQVTALACFYGFSCCDASLRYEGCCFSVVGLPKLASKHADNSEATKGAAIASQQVFCWFWSKII